MTIHVTPIPKLTEFATPNLTLTTANAAGAASTTTTIRSDASILTYDTTSPAAVAVEAAVGSASTAARRDHQHVGPVKAWGMMDANGTLNNSYNITSGSKVTTGDYDFVIATDLSASTFPAVANAYGNTLFTCACQVSTTDIDVNTFNSSGSAADVALSMICCGNI
jgi:hypothetical protein